MTLESLIAEFQNAADEGVVAFWRKADAAAAIRTHFPNHGLRTLRERTHYDKRTITRMVQLSRAFPAGQRDLSLSPTHHREALAAVIRFPLQSQEHDPHYWLRLSHAQGWTSFQLRRAMLDTLPTTPSVEDRRTRAERRFQEAERLVTQAKQIIERFNAEYAAIWGTELVLSERALSLPSVS